MSNHKTVSMPLTQILLVLFITLKLCKVIDWSWWWVLSPIWIWLGIIVGAFAITGICIIGCGLWKLFLVKRNERLEKKLYEQLKKNLEE